MNGYANNQPMMGVMGMSELKWETCLQISESPEVDEALRNFTEDSTEDNAVGLVQIISKYTGLSCMMCNMFSREDCENTQAGMYAEIQHLKKANESLEQQLKTAKPKLYRHIKTGGIYEFITDAEMESNLEDVVVYRSVEHKSVWIRPSSEFYDGRFEEYANNLEGK